MVHTNLIIALVFAALFGIALIWLAFDYIHRYIHLRYLELDHWFHLFTPLQWHSSCRHCEGTGRNFKEKSRSRSSRRRERSKSRGRRERSRHERRGEKMIEVDTEWMGIGQEEESMRRPTRALPSPSMQNHGAAEQYYTWQSQMPGGVQMSLAHAQPAMYTQAYSQMYIPTFPQPYAQGGPQALPYPVPQQQTAYMAIPTLSSVSSMPPYQKHPRKACAERPEPQTKSRHATRDGSRVRRTDYIHIVTDHNDLPPIVKEAIEKEAVDKGKREALSASSLSGSSMSTEPAEEVPRTSIPQATPRFAEPQPYQFSQTPHPTTRAWDAAGPYPWQWNGNTGRGATQNEQIRYASPPHLRPERKRSRHVDPERRRNVPSNTCPRCSALMDSCSERNMLTEVGDTSEPATRHPIQIPEHANKLRRTRRTVDRNDGRGNKKQGEASGGQVRAEAPDRACSYRGRPKVEDVTTMPTPNQRVIYEAIPNISPMPLPVVEEPVSDNGSTKGKMPIILGMPLDSTDDARPTAPPAWSPLLDIRSLSTSPLSAVSSSYEN
jgi:hypothetical protein